MPLNKFKSDMHRLKNPKKAKLLSGFFKTGKGEYGEGDIFLGIMVPQQREVSKNHNDLSLKDIQSLLSSKIHEYRLTALFILLHKYKHMGNKKEIVNFYLKNTKNINNWDLVDLSAPRILGDFLINKDRKILYKLAKSHLWDKRIAILATFAFIKKTPIKKGVFRMLRNKHVSDIREHDFKDSLRIAEILLKDKHDLIHKAVGWMLREIGKRNQPIEEKFLKRHCKAMPRTMLRYAIEKFPDARKKKYMAK